MAQLADGSVRALRQLGWLLLFAGSAHAQITPSFTVSRLWNCVAPCYVFFDARETTSSATSAPFHEIEYRWDFGDPGGAWLHGARTRPGGKDSASGPVAAHVFEKPGTYTVTLTAYDGMDTAKATRALEVSDPEAVFSGPATICVAAESFPVAGSDGCPAGAQTFRQGDFATIVNAYSRPGRRVLLRRGDSFSGPANARLDKQGPGIIGAYGAGPTPVIRTTGTAPHSTLLSVVNASDWRVMDLDFDGQAARAGDGGTHRNFVSGSGSNRQLLFLRVRAHDFGGGMTFGHASGPVAHDQLAVVDSEVRRLWSNSSASGLGIYLAGTRLAIMGNLLDDSTLGTAEHMLRIAYLRGGVISSNTIQKVNPAKEMIALRGICSSPCAGAGFHLPHSHGSGEAAATRWIVISDNQLKTNSYVGIQIDTAGSNSEETAIIRDVIVERNWHISQGGSSNSGVRIRAQDVTVRNELLDLTQARIAHGVQLFGRTRGDPVGSRNIRIYHNTLVALGPWVSDNGEVRIAEFVSPAGIADVWLQNNLAYAPNAGVGRARQASNAAVATYGGVRGIWVCANNSTGIGSHRSCGPNTNQIKLANPNFGAKALEKLEHWKPGTRSYVVGAGARVPVWSDFFMSPQPSPRDLGAVVH